MRRHCLDAECFKPGLIVRGSHGGLACNTHWQLGLVAHDLLPLDCCRVLQQIVIIWPSLSTRSAHLAANSGILVTLHSLNLKRVLLPVMASIIRKTRPNIHTLSKSSGLIHCVLLSLVLSASSFALG